jgi:hypothetical protein
VQVRFLLSAPSSPAAPSLQGFCFSMILFADSLYCLYVQKHYLRKALPAGGKQAFSADQF